MRKLSTDELNRISVDQFKNTKKFPIVLILDNVRSLNNVGAAFRTADAFLIEKIFLCGITGRPPHREIHKTALGATDSVAWEYQKEIIPLVTDLKNKGFKIIAIEQATNSLNLANYHPEQGASQALVFGNEVFGVDQSVLDLSDVCLEIPQFGTKHSLNISVSIGISIWDILNKLKPGLA